MQPPVRASSAEDLPDCSTDPTPSLPRHHTPSPLSRKRSKSVDELDYDSDGSGHTHSISSLPDVLWSSEDISVSKLKEMLGDTARKPAVRKRGGVKEGSGEGKTETETEVGGRRGSGEEATHRTTAKLKAEEKPSAGGGETDSRKEKLLSKQLESKSAAIHTDKNRSEDTPLSSEPLGMQVPVLSKESQEVVGGVAGNGWSQGVVGESSSSDSTSIKEIQPQAYEHDFRPAGSKQAPLQHPSLSPLTSPSPPSTPDSLAGDIQSLLSQLRAPVVQGNLNNNNSGSSTTAGTGGPVYHVKGKAE